MLYAIKVGKKFLQLEYIGDQKREVFRFELLAEPLACAFADKAAAERELLKLDAYLDDRIYMCKAILEENCRGLNAQIRRYNTVEHELNYLMTLPYKDVYKRIPKLQKTLSDIEWRLADSASWAKKLKKFEKIAALPRSIVELE